MKPRHCFFLDNEGAYSLNHMVKQEEEPTHFLAYFMTLCVVTIIGYLLFHNKQKVSRVGLHQGYKFLDIVLWNSF